MPTYNSSKYIEETIFTLNNLLINSNINYEIIIVDDFSNDETHKLLRKMTYDISNLYLFRLKNNYGQKLATQYGISKVQGRFIVTFDDDLQYYPEDILMLYNEIVDSKLMVICGYYSTDNHNVRMIKLRKVLFYFFNNIIFYRYRHSNYFTSFKIFDKLLLQKNRIQNIYHFWDINEKAIGGKKVKKRNRISGDSHYNFKKLFLFMAPIFLKIFEYFFLFILLPISLLIYFIHDNNFYVITSIVVIILIKLYLRMDKYRTAYSE